MSTMTKTLKPIITQKSIQGLLFDKDGTLFDYQTTWGPWAQKFIAHLAKGNASLEETLASAFEFDLAAGRFLPHSHFIADTPEQVFDSVLSVVPEMSHDELEAIYYESTEQAALVSPVPLAPLLELFSSHGIKLGVATNDHEEAAHRQLRSAEVATHFDFIAGFNSGFGAKPESGMQHAFCAATGLKPENVAMVGDSTHDLESGRRANMPTIGVLTGPATREELTPHATVVLNHIGEIPEWLNMPAVG